MAFGPARKALAAFVAAAAIACGWLNQGPSSARYDELLAQARASKSLVLHAWLPFAFAYRRSADEELYFAIGSAIRGAPFDREILLSKRGDASIAFRKLPPADGRWHVPYAEVPFEYPAIVLPFILLPALAATTFAQFAMWFGALMGGLLLASTELAIRALPDLRGAARAQRWWLAGALFLAQGGLLIQRLDAVAAVFLAFGLWAAVRRRPFLMGLGIALAAAAKILPMLVLLPMMAADRDAWRSRRAIGSAAAGVALGLAAGFVPMLLLSPSGFADFVRYHAARGLHIESTYGTVISVVRFASGNPEPATLSFGSFNLDDPAARLCASAAGYLLVAAIAALTAWLARRPAPATASARADAVARAGLLGLTCIWLFGKVFSPQYLTWGIPFAVGASSRRPALALLLAMAISQIYLRGFYDQVVEMRALGVAALGIRLAAIVAMAVLLGRALSGGRDGTPSEPSS